MDHLILPQSSQVQPSKVRCVCLDNELYDSHDYATFPVRRCWPEILGSDKVHPYWASSISEVIDNELMQKREKVLQAWVFFGLLYEMLSPFYLYDEREYIEIDAMSQRWITTSSLNSRITRWHNMMKVVDAKRKVALLTHFRACLTVAIESLLVLNNANYATFDRMIKISLIAACNTAIGMFLSQMDEGVHTFSPGLRSTAVLLDRELMSKNGWCPSEIKGIHRHHSLHISTTWYLQNLRKSDDPQIHGECTTEICRLSQSSSKSIPKHVQASCDCTEVGANLHDILDCLRAGDIPVLEVQGEELRDLTLIVHRLSSLDEEEVSYVAISHVWADGLGNSESTSLPRCQVQRLNHLLLKMKQHDFYVGENRKLYVHRKRVMLWCDTLCVPAALEHKSLAMRKMRDVYLQASFVLVLDKELEKHRYADIGPIEAGWRISLSQYMGRLWTYQEAGLAKRLIVQFADAPVDILPIMRAGRQMYYDSPVREFVYMGVAANLAAIRSWLHAEPRTAWIKEAAMGLCYRHVSYISDEPICIGTVLGLDSERLMQTVPENRNEMLWSLISQHQRGVCESVVFNTLDRLTTPGYRWAPASLLQSIERPLDTVSLPDDNKSGVLTSRGLRICRAGWRIQLGRLPGSLPDAFWPHFEGGDALTLANHPDGTSYNIFRAPYQDKAAAERSVRQLVSDTSREWYIILQHPETKFEYVLWKSQQSGLLVSKESGLYGLTYFRTHMLVVVDRVRPGNELRRRADFLYGRAIQDCWTLSAFNWLVYGENIIGSVFAWLPARLRTPAAAICDSAVANCARSLATRIKNMLIRNKTEAPKLSQVAALLQGPEAATIMSTLGSELVQAFMGRYVDVVGLFDSSTEWCVD